MPQFESVEELRRVRPGQVATLIPSWNTGFPLRPTPGADPGGGALVRPGQRLEVLGEEGHMLRVRQEAEGLEGWIPAHVVTAWPQP